jgi:hypothetical protein
MAGKTSSESSFLPDRDGWKCRFDPIPFSCHRCLMAATLEEITRQALQLPLRQRFALAGFLLETDDVTADAGVDEAWDQEIQRRIGAVDRGTVEGISYQDVMREADKLIAP